MDEAAQPGASREQIRLLSRCDRDGRGGGGSAELSRRLSEHRSRTMTKERLSLSGEGAASAAPTAPQLTGPTMEVCECSVRLGGDVRNDVLKQGVTPPELILLRAIHGGAETVFNVKVIGTTPYNSVRERGRLMALYPRYQEKIG